jgi:phospholipase D1/2
MTGLMHLPVSWDTFNARFMSHDTFLDYITQSEKASGVKFYEAQVALSRKWIDGDILTSQKTVKINTPQETTEGLVHSDKTQKDFQEFPIPESEEQAEQTISRFEQAARSVRSDERVSDNVVQHMLQDRTSLKEEQWEGTEEEELNAYAILI